MIIDGISSLTSAAGTAASVVLTNKQAIEQQRHNKQIEQIASQGNGISNKEIKLDEPKVLSNKSLPVKRTMYDDEFINKSMNFLRGKGFIIYI